MTIDLNPNWAGWLLLASRMVYVALVFWLHGTERRETWDARTAVTQTIVALALLYAAGAFSGGSP